MNSRILGALGVSLLAASLHAQRIDTVLATNLSEPRGITSDGSAIYIADSGNNRILKYTKEGVMSPLAGKIGASGTGYHDDVGTRALFSDPQGIVYSAARGGLIVADFGNSAIRLVNLSSRQVSTIGGVGQQDGYWDGGPGTSLYSFPAGVDIDTNSGTVYVADFGNGLIRAIDSANNTTTYVDLGASSPSQISAPTAVAVGRPGELWVSDSYNNVIWLVTSNASGITAVSVAGQFGMRGTNDADIGTEGRLSEPWGLLWRGWLGPNSDLIVSDSGNNTLRRIYTNSAPDVQAYSLALFSGTPGQAGSLDAVVPTASFNRPMGLGGVPSSGSFYVADSASGRIRLYSDNTQPIKQVSDPQIGYVTFDLDKTTGNITPTFHDLTGTSTTFNNYPLIACMESDSAQVHVTYGTGPLSVVPDPTVASTVIKLFPAGAEVGDVPQSLPHSAPDMFVKAIAEKSDGSPPSTTVHAEFKFQVASPVILGKNAASLSITDSTTNAVMFYTLDGTEPTTNSTRLAGSPVTIPITVDTRLEVKAFDWIDNFTPSEATILDLKASDYQANQLVWGFDSGEGASQFVGAPGQNFYAPIALIMVPGQPVYAFQFDAWIVRDLTTPWTPTFDFRSDLYQLIATGYYQIPPNLFAKELYATNLVVSTDGISTNTVIVTNLSDVTGAILSHDYVNSLEVGWAASYPNTNILYDTTKQDLVNYAISHDTLHENQDKIVIGSMSFAIPGAAATGAVYQIELHNTSGTDKSARPILMQVITNGSLSGGSINAIKKVYLDPNPPKYLVGSLLPFRWFNAGEFGTNSMGSGDIIQTFNVAVYGPNLPTNCDMYNAMDSATTAVNTDWTNDPAGEFASINSMTNGDGKVDLNDLYVNFRRSLDASLNWYNRYWTNGSLTNELTQNLLATPTNLLRKAAAKASLRSPAPKAISSGPHSARIPRADILATAGQMLEVPINAEIIGEAPIRTHMLNIRVVALDGSPEITNAISYYETDSLATSSKLTTSRGANNFAGAWLDTTVDGVYGTNQIGVLLVNLPGNVTSNAAYIVHFDKFSASPNGLAMFPTVAEDTLVTLSDRSGSSWNDGISDAWRLRYFGTVSNLLSAANADADGDGVSNLAEYLAGTNPVDPLSKPVARPPSAPSLGLLRSGSDSAPTFTLQWTSEIGHVYFVESSPDIMGTNWVALSTNLPGSGAVTQFTDTNSSGVTKFYRVRAQ